MTKMRHNNRNTNKRSNKVTQGTQQIIEEKFEEERKLPPIQALNEKQKNYINLLKTCNIITIIIYISLHLNKIIKISVPFFKPL